MKASGIRLYFIIAVSALMLVVLGVTGVLNISSFRQNYTQSLISSYGVLGGETVKKIEYAVKYGKPLESFFGIEELLEQVRSDSGSIEQVYVVLPDGRAIYDIGGAVSGRMVASELWEQAAVFAQGGAPPYVSYVENDRYHLHMPIRDRNGGWIGNLELIFSKSVVQNSTDNYMYQLILFLCGFAFFAVIVLVVFVTRVSLVDEEGKVRKKRLFIFIFTLLGLIQLAFGTANYIMLQNSYLDTLKDNTAIVLKVIERDIETVVDKGLPYSKLHGVGDYLRRLIETVPEVERISLVDAGYTSERLTEELHASQYTYSVPLRPDHTGIDSYRAVVDLSQSYIGGKMREMLLDTATMVIISFLLMVEITIFVFLLLNRRLKAERAESGADAHAEAAAAAADRTVIRPLAFIVFTSLYMSTAFIPVLMKSLYVPLFGLSEKVVIGLPISAELLFMAIASLSAGYMVDRRGWKPVFTLGCLILAVGTIASGLAWEPVGFIAARALAGLGFGCALMSMQAFVVTAPSDAAKNDALAALNSGAYAGINCGVVVGAMLADRLGFAQVFFVAFALVGVAALFAIKMLHNVRVSSASPSVSAEAGAVPAVPAADASAVAPLLELGASTPPATAIAADADRAAEQAAATVSSGQNVADSGNPPVITMSRKERLELLRLERLSSKKSVGGFIGNMNVITYFLFLLIPLSICSMFLYYFFPVFAEEGGLSPSNIGRAFLLYGLCIVYLGPLLSGMAERWLGSKFAVSFAAALVISALLMFAAVPTLPVAIIAVVMLGVAEGFGLTASINYYIGLRAARWLGEGKAMGYWSLVENFGQMIGPMLLGALLVLGDASAISIIGMMMAGALTMFWLTSRKEKQLPAAAGAGGERV